MRHAFDEVDDQWTTSETSVENSQLRSSQTLPDIHRNLSSCIFTLYPIVEAPFVDADDDSPLLR